VGARLRDNVRAKVVAMNRVRGAVGLLFVAASGCGGGTSTPQGADGSAGTPPEAAVALTDVSGWYQVTSDLSGPCGMTTTSPFTIPYVWVERLQNTFIFHVCTGTTEADCTGTEFYDFTTPIENGLSAEGGSAFFSAGCTLTVERATLTLVGTQLHAHSLKDQANLNLPESQCTLDAALMLTMPCTYETDIQATRLR
jgi:hypothetical protein